MVNIKKLSDLSEINNATIYTSAPRIPRYIKAILTEKITIFSNLDKSLCLRYIEYTNKYFRLYRRGLITSDELLKAVINFTWEYIPALQDYKIIYLTLNYNY